MLRRATSLRSAREHYKVSKENRSSSRKLVSKTTDEMPSDEIPRKKGGSRIERKVFSDSVIAPLDKGSPSTNGIKKKKKKKGETIKEKKKSASKKKDIEEAFPGVRIRTESRPPIEIEKMRKEWEKEKEELEKKSRRKKQRDQEKINKKVKGGTTIGIQTPLKKDDDNNDKEKETKKEKKKKKKKPEPVESFPGIRVRTESRPPFAIEQMREQLEKENQESKAADESNNKSEKKKKKKKEREAKTNSDKDINQEEKATESDTNTTTTEDEPKKKKKKKKIRTSDVTIEVFAPVEDNKDKHREAIESLVEYKAMCWADMEDEDQLLQFENLLKGVKELQGLEEKRGREKEKENENEREKRSEREKEKSPSSKKSKNRAKKDARRSLNSVGGKHYQSKSLGASPAKLQLTQSSSSNVTTRSLTARVRGSSPSPSESPHKSAISARSSSDADSRKVSLSHSTGGTDVATSLNREDEQNESADGGDARKMKSKGEGEETTRQKVMRKVNSFSLSLRSRKDANRIHVSHVFEKEEEHEGPRLNGYLHMLSAEKGKWQRYWFLIHDGFLLPYNRPESRTLASKPIDLLFSSIRELEVAGDQKHCFLIEEEDNSAFLSASSATELEEWLSSLRETIDQLRERALLTSGVNLKTQDSDSIILSAWLSRQKTKMGIKKWRKRWCVLKPGVMFMYKTKESIEPDASVELLFAQAKEVANTNQNQGNDDQWEFELLTSTKTYYFATEFQKMRDQWLNAIKQMNADLMNNHLKATVRDRKMSVVSLAESGILVRGENRNALLNRDRLEKMVSSSSKGNNLCADCGAKQPTWASINLGIFICLECAGIHRSLGVDISQVRSITLDEWETETVDFMQAFGNDKGNEKWIPNLPSDMKPIRPDSTLEERKKYIKLKYAPPEDWFI